MAYKKISEFPVTTSTDVLLFGRNLNNKNVQVKLNEAVVGSSVKIGRQILNDNINIAPTTTITDAIDLLSTVIGRVSATIKSSDNSIIVTEDLNDGKTDLKLNIGRIVSSKSGLTIKNNSIELNIDNSEDNNLYLTEEGKLRSDTKWKLWKN